MAAHTVATMTFGHKLSDEQTGRPQSPELTGRILVIEDDPSVRRILKRLFEAEGLAFDMYSDGRAGLDSFHAEQVPAFGPKSPVGSDGFPPPCNASVVAPV